MLRESLQPVFEGHPFEEEALFRVVRAITLSVLFLINGGGGT